ncbi:MAG: hypothetical protein V3V08_14230 [Nannocystaceae bacterium]
MASDLPEKVILHLDHASVGVYGEPFVVVRLTDPPTGPPTLLVEAVRTDDGYKIVGNATEVQENIRLRPPGCPLVLDWLGCPRNTAWVWLTVALPGFWLCRHPLRGRNVSTCLRQFLNKWL